MTKRIIDSHLDLALNALHFDRDQKETVDQINRREVGMTDSPARRGACVSLPEMRRGRMAVCLATVLCRAKPDVRPSEGHRRVDIDWGSQDFAYAIGQAHLAYYRLLEAQGELVQIRTRSELDAHWQRWESGSDDTLPVGYILAMEGADPIVSPAQVEHWWDAGLRSVILAHYGHGFYADGTGETGGLTPRGRELVAELDRVGMILDLTHSTDRSFAEAMELFAGPVMASHTNCRALVPGDRQFTDEQIRALVERDAVIGVALDAWMLRPGWVRGETRTEGMTLDILADHIDHICELAGNVAHVAIGSDLDGGFGADQRPEDLDSISDLHKLAPILSGRGYSDEGIDDIFHGNWLRFFRRYLPA
jgi:membrane dipeptidase